MADNPTQRDAPDPDRINTANEGEMNYWCEKWGVTREQIIACVKKVGASVQGVQRCLGK
jgi:hypothetical protein